MGNLESYVTQSSTGGEKKKKIYDVNCYRRLSPICSSTFKRVTEIHMHFLFCKEKLCIFGSCDIKFLKWNKICKFEI